jgi:hypothetical protein
MERVVTVTIRIDPSEYHDCEDSAQGAVDLISDCLRGDADFSEEGIVIVCDEVSVPYVFEVLNYGGSSEYASENWPSISFRTEEEARRAYVLTWRNAGVPYGSYVLVGKILRLETEALKKLVLSTIKSRE